MPTGTVVWCLPFTTVTVPVVPLPRTAELGTCNTLSFSAVITLTDAVMPGFTLGSVWLSPIVALYVTTLLTNVDVEAMLVTDPGSVTFGRAEKLTVAG